jgi:hypothetical protein
MPHWRVVIGVVAVLTATAGFGATAGIESTAAAAALRPISSRHTFACALQSSANHRYVAAEVQYAGGLNGALRARSTSVGGWETFQCVPVGTSGWAIKSTANGKYVSAELGYRGTVAGTLRARASSVGPWETFALPFVGSCSCYALRASGSRYVTSEIQYRGSLNGLLRARSSSVQGWEQFGFMDLTVVPPTASDWTTYFQGNARSGWATSNDALTPASAPNLRLAWKASDSGVPEPGVFSQPIVTNGKVYWGSFDGYERATDTTGHLAWQTFLGHTKDPPCVDPDSAGIASTATITSDVRVGNATSVLYVGGGDSKMYALNAVTGAVLWSHAVGPNPDNFVWSSPAVFGNSVYIGVASFGDCPLVQGKVLQLNRTTGALQHTFAVVPPGCTGAGVWGSPTVDAAAGTIYFTTGNAGDCASAEPLGESIVEVHASDLSLVGSWPVPPAEQQFDTDFGSTPTLFTGVVGDQTEAMVGAINKNGFYYAFARDNLDAGPVWQDRIADGGDDPLNGTGDAASSAFDGTTLYVAGDTTTIDNQSCTGSLNALDPGTGTYIWRDCLTDGFALGGVTGANGGVVAIGEGNNIAVYSSATGASVFTYAGTGPFFGPPSIAHDAVYEGDMSGHLYALTLP